MSHANEPLQDEIIRLLPARKGHFRYESGHHGDLWLDVERIFLRPHAVRPFAAELARRLSAHGIEAVCGPLVGGAFLARMIAEELDAEFWFAERIAHPEGEGLYPITYRIPEVLRERARGRRFAVVDDVINAGSAIRATVADLESCGGMPVVMGALLILGNANSELAADRNLCVESLSQQENTLWNASQCPLCKAGVPLELPGKGTFQERSR